MQARDERLALAWMEANPPLPCPGCGRPTATRMPGTGTGRRRIYCSNACRQRAYRARHVQSDDDASPEPPKPEPLPASEPQMKASSIAVHDLDSCIIAVLEQPAAIASVLDVVRRALDDGVLSGPEFRDVRSALAKLLGNANLEP